jgi:hypothetical protein
MSTPLRIGGFVAALALLFAAAFGVGKLFDGGDPAGYGLRLSTTQSGSTVKIRFSVVHAGDVVTKFAVRHEKRLHLIVVRKDFAQFRHVHPTMSPDGNWSIDTALPGGQWRLFADFQPGGGANQVVHRDVSVTGSPEAPAVRQPYQVGLSGMLTAGGAGSMLSFRVTEHGRPVKLQPYLGAFGHLVVLRDTDMKYLHVHPQQGPATGPIPFHVEVPTAGRYHLYLDYQVAGVVHTASFVLDATAAAGHGSEMHDMGGNGDMRGMGGMDHGDH